MRHNENNIYIFVMNFTDEEKKLVLEKEEYIDMISGELVSKEIRLEKYGVKVLKK
jgi:beta-galactosidase